MKSFFLILASAAAIFPASAWLAPAALAQRNDVTGALTGTNVLAPVTTGIGQAVEPIIKGPFSPQEPGSAPGQERGLVVPYPVRGGAPPTEQPGKSMGNYYGTEIRQTGEYYPTGARVQGAYQPFTGIPETAQPPAPAEEKKPAAPKTPTGGPAKAAPLTEPAEPEETTP